MATTVTVFGKEKPQSETKKIELCLILMDNGKFEKNSWEPSEWNYVELIERLDEYDVINVWDEGDIVKLTILGHWNDGVV